MRIERGLVRSDDERHLKEADSEQQAQSDRTPSVQLSAKLVEDLSAQKTTIIGAELMRQPKIALAATVHTLALSAFYPGRSEASCVRLHRSAACPLNVLAEPATCEALSAQEKERERWEERLPGDPSDLWPWCLENSQDVLLDILAFIASQAVNAVQAKANAPDSARLQHANALAQALSLNMASRFRPTAQNFFSRISRASILAAVDEAKGGYGPGLEKLKKADLAARAESMIADTNWLPEPMRTEPSRSSEIADETTPQAEAAE